MELKGVSQIQTHSRISLLKASSGFKTVTCYLKVDEKHMHIRRETFTDAAAFSFQQRSSDIYGFWGLLLFFFF